MVWKNKKFVWGAVCKNGGRAPIKTVQLNWLWEETLVPTTKGFVKAKELIGGETLFNLEGKPFVLEGVDRSQENCVELGLKFGRKLVIGENSLVPSIGRTENVVLLGANYLINKGCFTHQNVWRYGNFCGNATQFGETAPLAYLTGLFLGDGVFTASDSALCLSSGTNEIPNKIGQILQAEVRKTGEYAYVFVKNGKRIKREELFGSEVNCKCWEKKLPNWFDWNLQSRIELLKGLCDTDGCTTPHGLKYTSTSLELCSNIIDVVYSVGLNASLYMRKPTEHRQAYDVYISGTREELSRLVSESSRVERLGKGNKAISSTYVSAENFGRATVVGLRCKDVLIGNFVGFCGNF